MPSTEKIGKLLKPHGLKGHISLFLNKRINVDFSALKMLFIELNGVQTPFFIENYFEHAGKIVLKLENISSEAEAKKISQKEVAVFSEHLIVSEELTEEDMLGFLLLDKNEGELGKIENVQEFPQHYIFTVIFKGKEVLLPVTEAFIEKVDWETKTVYYAAPEGLLDVYLK